MPRTQPIRRSTLGELSRSLGRREIFAVRLSHFLKHWRRGLAVSSSAMLWGAGALIWLNIDVWPVVHFKTFLLVTLGPLAMCAVWLFRVETAEVRAMVMSKHPHLCRGCGYDLRGTPDRCPECGAVR